MNSVVLRICDEYRQTSFSWRRACKTWQLEVKLGSRSAPKVRKWSSASNALIIGSGLTGSPSKLRARSPLAVSSTSTAQGARSCQLMTIPILHRRDCLTKPNDSIIVAKCLRENAGHSLHCLALQLRLLEASLKKRSKGLLTTSARSSGGPRKRSNYPAELETCGRKRARNATVAVTSSCLDDMP